LSEETLVASLLRRAAMSNTRRFVYIIQSIRTHGAYYTGLTSDPDARLTAHNAGASQHTAAQRPWKKLVVVEFDEEEPAVLFEKYLKTGSGREFARRHFRQRVSG
jgi:putative endonuclease